MRRNGLLYLDVDELSDLSDRLAEAQPFLGTLWRDPSLRGLFRMLELVIDESLKEVVRELREGFAHRPRLPAERQFG